MKTSQTTIARIMRIFELGINVLWIGISIAALILGGWGFPRVEERLNTTLTDVNENVDTLYNLLVETDDVIAKTNLTLKTTENSLKDASTIIDDTGPLVEETSQVVTEDLPLALEGMQNSMPTLIDTATAVDQTLRLLSAINLAIPLPFGKEFTFGLGISYAPEVSLDQALEDFNTNLEGVPKNLRGLEDNLETTEDNLEILSTDLDNLASDVGDVNNQIKDLEPQLESLAKNTEDLQTTLKSKQESYQKTWITIQIIYFTLWTLILLGQIPATYELVTSDE